METTLKLAYAIFHGTKVTPTERAIIDAEIEATKPHRYQLVSE